MIRLGASLIAFLALATAGMAQNASKQETSGEVEVLFANGSLVRLALVQDKIDVDTQFGKLSVPLKKIRRIEFGLHMPEGTDKKIDAAIKQLASDDFKERDGAVRDLVALGAYSYSALLKAARSPELEVSKRAADALARLRAKVPAKELGLGQDDRVVTNVFTIVGRIVSPSIKARTEYFGEATLTLHQLRHLRVLVDSKDADVTLDAAKYASPNQWLETNVAVDAMSVLSVSASGQVDLRPQVPGNYVCGPGGFGTRGGPGGPGGPVAAAAGFGKKAAAGFGAAVRGPRVYPGILLGRIGEHGDIFEIGERFEGTLEREGKLYLHINPSQYDTVSSGAYQVRISVRN